MDEQYECEVEVSVDLEGDLLQSLDSVTIEIVSSQLIASVLGEPSIRHTISRTLTLDAT